MPLTDQPHPRIVNQRLPMKIVVVNDMKEKDQISSKKTHMVKTRQMRKIFGIHTKIKKLGGDMHIAQYKLLLKKFPYT